MAVSTVYLAARTTTDRCDAARARARVCVCVCLGGQWRHKARVGYTVAQMPCEKGEKKKKRETEDQEEGVTRSTNVICMLSPLRVASLLYEPSALSRDARHQSDASSCPDNTLLLAYKKSSVK